MENNVTSSSEKLTKKGMPKKGVTIFLIISTMMLSLALVIGGVYSLYVSIGFSFLRGSAVGGINTTSLYTYSNSNYGTGGGSLVGLIIISIIMLGLGVGMAVIFFKQLPLYRQIKLVAKLPNVKYKQYSSQVKKSVITFSIIGYIVCIGFCVFAIYVASRQPLSTNYKWVVLLAFSVVLALAISSMVLMFVKLGQLAKIKKLLKQQEEQQHLKETLLKDNLLKVDSNIKESDDLPHKDNKQNKINLRDDNGLNLDIAYAHKQPDNGLIEQQAQLISQMSRLLCQVYKPESQDNAYITKQFEQMHSNPNKIVESITDNSSKPNLAKPEDTIFETGVFELSSALQKLREIHINGLIDSAEYTQIRQKWINAMLKQPLFGQNKKTTKSVRSIKSAIAGPSESNTKPATTSSVVTKNSDVTI